MRSQLKDVQPRPRRDPHRRRPDRRPVGPDQRTSSSTSASTRSASLFAQIVGYQSFVNLVGSTGVEESYNDVLTGQDTSLQLERPRRPASTGKRDTSNVVLSLTESAQQTAADALGDQHGSVVALDVQTGAVWRCTRTRPSTRTASPVTTPQVVQTTFNLLNSGDEARAASARTASATPRARRSRSSPASRRIETGIATPDDRVFPTRTASDPGHRAPTLAQLRRRAPAAARSRRASSHSCNTTFAQLGYELGDAVRARDAASAASTSAPPLDLAPGAVESVGPARRALETTSPRSRSPASARATCSPRRCRWRSSPRASPTAA